MTGIPTATVNLDGAAGSTLGGHACHDHDLSGQRNWQFSPLRVGQAALSVQPPRRTFRGKGREAFLEIRRCNEGGFWSLEPDCQKSVRLRFVRTKGTWASACPFSAAFIVVMTHATSPEVIACSAGPRPA